MKDRTATVPAMPCGDEQDAAMKRVREIVEESERQVRDFFDELEVTPAPNSDSLRNKPRKPLK